MKNHFIQCSSNGSSRENTGEEWPDCLMEENIASRAEKSAQWPLLAATPPWRLLLRIKLTLLFETTTSKPTKYRK